MTRNLKTLGVTLVAALALSAVAASASSASTFSSSVQTGYLVATGNNTQEFETTVDNLTCEEVEVAHEATEFGEPDEKETYSATTITVKPIYKNCKAVKLGLTTHVEFGGCEYTFSADIEGEGGEPLVKIDCPAEEEVEIKATLFGSKFACVNVPEQEVTEGTVEYTNLGGTEGIEVSSDVKGIEYSHQGICGSGSGSEGTYKGEVTVSATNTAETETVSINWTK